MNKHIPPTNNEQRHILDVPGLSRELHLQMQRYIQAQYPLRHREIIVERQELLKTAGVLSQEPFIESMPGYAPGPLYAGLALSPLFTGALTDLSTWPSPTVPSRLYQHQATALETFFRDERDLILVTGTGSGCKFWN